MTDLAPPTLPLTAVILAGGKSTRMGTDKALLRLGESTLLERICALVTPLFDETLIIAASAAQCASLDLVGASVLQDEPDIRGRGPLAGIYTGLRNARHETVCFLTCDMPFVDSTILRHLTAQQDTNADVTCFKGESKHHEPFPGIFHRRLLESLSTRLERNELSLCRYLDQVTTRHLPIPHAAQLVFINTNTPQEFQSAAHHHAQTDHALTSRDAT
jgi:molybdopterin-guanine dinucleotide biosynthesis protein A